MTKIRLLGAMESLPVQRGLRTVTFEKGKAIEVEDDLALELMGRNPDELTVERAAPYGIPVFELVDDDESEAPPLD